jgi:hypothetical protein
MDILKKIGKWLHVHTLEVTSLFIAFLALFTSVYQAELSRKHNRLSVVPIIYFSFNKIENELSIINHGTGPGIVQSLELKTNDEYLFNVNFSRLRSIVKKLIEDNNLNLASCDYSVSAGKSFMVINSNHNVPLLKLINEDRKEDFAKLTGMLEFGICYKSIYNDRFFIKSSDFEIPDGSCAYADTVKIFGNHYRFRGFFNQPLSQTELLGKYNANKSPNKDAQ